MTKQQPVTSYGRGYLAAAAGQPKEPPASWVDRDRKAWLRGFRAGQRDARAGRTGRPEFTR